ncbi:hypothetical protein JFX23_06775 [Schaalia cardiffensis]|uniref:SCO6880 family protein n=1 Tax=Schaalia cardiffensis TaxID=181487 RepID=UPI0018E7C090|nr:SCO6880 family protein [Schaalia cardiffensis]MBJ2329465.1 hypothetical protein [Schaalia cardiffensis]
MSNTDTPAPRTYGNWRRPTAAGLGKLSFGASMGLLGAMILIVLIYSTLGLRWSVGFGLVSAAAIWAVSARDRHGISVADRTGERMRFWWASRTKRTIYRSGPLTPTAASTGKCSLPGIAAASTISEQVDSYDRPYALIRHADGSLAVVIKLAPSGADLLDVNQVDLQVAYWGQWLADLGGELGIVGASVCVETTPDTGKRLEREVRRRVDPAAPELSQQIMREIVVDYRAGSAQVRTWLTLVFEPAKMGSRKRSFDQAARDIGTRLPGLTQTLVAAGAGAVHLMTVEEVVRLVRVAYDPACESLFEDAAAAGEDVHVSWDDAGPVSALALWDSYRHDSGVSRSWVVTAPPRGVVQSSILRTILSANSDVDRKRVTILYHPMDAGLAPDVVEADVNMARARVETSGRPTARAKSELQAAQQVAAEEAGGAGLVDFGIIMTATTSAPEDTDDTSSAMAALAAASRLQVRIAYGAQDSAFALGLPLGLRPPSQQMGGAR